LLVRFHELPRPGEPAHGLAEGIADLQVVADEAKNRSMSRALKASISCRTTSARAAVA
jgi:hypothetical protein